MNNKIVIISSCAECPSFDNHYHSYNDICDLLKRKPYRGEPSRPSYNQRDPECPLMDTSEDKIGCINYHGDV